MATKQNPLIPDSRKYGSVHKLFSETRRFLLNICANRLCLIDEINVSSKKRRPYRNPPTHFSLPFLPHRFISSHVPRVISLR